MGNIFRKKSLKDLSVDLNVHESADGSGLKRVLNVKDLTLMGVAAVIGAGIFSTIGSAAYNGGPGVIFLFVITAITCGFTALAMLNLHHASLLLEALIRILTSVLVRLWPGSLAGHLFWNMLSVILLWPFPGVLTSTMFLAPWESIYPAGSP